MTGLLLTLRLILAGVFGLAGIAKLLDRPGSRQSMREFGVPAALAGPLAIGLPVAELACAVALVPGAYAWWAAVGGLTLLAAFTVAILANLARGRTPDCHCFGRIHSEPVGWPTVARNVVLMGMAAFVSGQGPANAGPGPLEWMATLDRTEASLVTLALCLALVAVGSGVALIQLLAQNGRLMLRIEAIEAKLGGRASLETPAETGLPLNTAAPAFTVRDLDGLETTLHSLTAPGTPLVLLFSEPGCGACEQAMPDIARWQRQHEDRLRLVLITRGDLNLNKTKAAAHHLRDVVLQTDREVSEAYRVAVTPSAVLIRHGLIASAVAAGYDAIRDLVFANTLPPPVKRPGQPSPPLELPDLDGNVLDIATLKGKQTALLFWDPACGFCQAMLNDLRSWERTKPRRAPELIVVSTGTQAANRGQRLRSRVLLDPSFGTGRVFGASGTPSAVLLDEAGRLASDVGVGAPAVFELLRSSDVRQPASAQGQVVP